MGKARPKINDLILIPGMVFMSNIFDLKIAEIK
jgi:hypothetical protein